MSQGAAELEFVATMRDEATAAARGVRQGLDRLGGQARPIDVPLVIDAAQARRELDRLPREADGSISRTSREFQQLSPEMRAAMEAAMTDAERALNGLPPAAGQAGQQAGQQAGSGMAEGLSGAKGKIVAAVGALGLASLLEDAISQEAATDKLAASLGLAGKRAARFGKVSAELYAGAWGESLEDVSASVEAVASSFPARGAPGVKAAAADALNFAKIFEVDVSRAAMTAGNAVRMGLADNATEAFDLLTAASQRVPKELREDLYDANNEYAQFFNSLGFSGERAFSVLVAGAAKGVYGIDKAGDAVKEFTIRSTDMSTASQDAYKLIGLDAETMADAILAGGDRAQTGLQKVITGLLGIESPSKRANAAIALFGTPVEDLNVRDIPAFLRSLQGTERGLGNVEGAAKRAGDTLNGNAQTELTAFAREAKMLAVDVLGREVVPALRDVTAWADDNLMPALKVGADVVGDLAHMFNGLPGPLQQFVVVGGAAALVMPKISAGLASMATSTMGYVGSLRNAATRQAALMQGARAAAGPAGIGLLIASTQTSSGELEGLLKVGAGAAVGFSMAGPIGALIGGGGAGLLGLIKTARDASGAADRMRAEWAEVKSTLDQTTGATTAATRAFVYDKLQRDGVLDTLAAEGIGRREAVDAILGEKVARASVLGIIDREAAELATLEERLATVTAERGKYNAATAKGGVHGEEGERARALATEEVALRKQIEAQRTSVNAIRDGIGAIEKETAAQKERADAVNDYDAMLTGIANRKKIVTYLEVNGIPRNEKAVAKMQRSLNATPKRVRTILEALNVDVSRKRVAALVRDMEQADKTRFDLPEVRRGVEKATEGAAKRAAIGADQIVKDLTAKPKRARVEMPQLPGSVTSAVNPARTQARIGGEGIGNDLELGILRGFQSTAYALAAAARAAVRGAITAGRNEGKIKSPSRETMSDGENLAVGYAIGLRKGADKPRNEARALMAALLKDLVLGGTEDQARSAVDKLGTRIEAMYADRLRKVAKAKLKAADTAREKNAARKLLDSVDDRAAKATRAALKGLRDETAALIANGKARDTLKGKIKDATDAGIAFAQSMKDYANVASVATVNDAPLTAGFIAQDLKAKLAQVKAFRRNLASLRGRLDDDMIAELEAGGVELGGAAAAALAAATQAQLDEINQSNRDLGVEADAAGKESVAQLVKGLTSDLAAVDVAGRTIAARLRAALLAELGIGKKGRGGKGGKSSRTHGREVASNLAVGMRDGEAEAVAQARTLARRVEAASTPSLNRLGVLAAQAARVSPVVRVEQVVTLRHEIRSPDRSVSKMTAEQIADVIARDPKSAGRIATLLATFRGRVPSINGSR